MNVIGIILVMIINAVFLILLLKSDKGVVSEKDSISSNEIKHPNLLKLIAIFGSFTMEAILINGFFKNEKLEWWLWGGGILLLLISLGLVIETFNWRVIIYKETFHYRTFFKKSYIFKFDEIDKCAVTSYLIVMRCKDKWLFMDPNINGITKLMDEIEPIVN